MDRRPAAEKAASRGVWLPGIVNHIARFMSANEIACTLRLVDKQTSQQFNGHRETKLSVPSPTHAFKRRWGSPNAFRGFSRLQRQKLLCLTAASGSIANLEIALDNAGLVASSELLNAAAAAGQLEVCVLLRQRGCLWGDALLASAARAGHRHVCEWLLANGCPARKSPASGAARGGHEGLMYWLMERQQLQAGPAEEFDLGKLLRAAAAGLNLEALQRLRQHLLAGHHQPQPQQQQGQDGEEEEDEVQSAAVLDAHQKARVLGAAAGSPTPDWRAKVKWLEGLGYPRTEHAVKAAASFASRNNADDDDDSIGRLQWLCDRGYPPTSAAAEPALKHGSVAVLHLLVERGVVPPGRGSRAQMHAAHKGHVAVLQYLLAHGDRPSPSTVSINAADGGQLHVVAWAVEALNVTPNNNPDLLDRAASSGNMQLLTWLQERGWTWGPEAVFDAAEGGCEEALEWLVLEQGCPLPADGRPYSAATPHGDLAMVRCLHRLGCPWGPNQIVKSIRLQAPIPMLRCLVELGCPIDWEAAHAAARRQSPGEYRTALMEWLGQERRRRGAPHGPNNTVSSSSCSSSSREGCDQTCSGSGTDSAGTR
ncbi:hypothetical protein PLESTB_000590000 [Pleodorina starrii]|uniref:Ankyrin repeat domain-containing protein n=1 Tax=Pleodorina starrii TaxID=330485 RepID=A0A9W6BHJ0_9CHLO|nr:hypothetical protein PLESTM_000763200 [Pleodorina starrii]GLC52164.1 hypothetical protein PLESTB_000590000 [Pleodorina starrii]GLC75791.1 hypothetical protein PLESTF_001687800 [Pleodorina starrii]